MEDQGVTPSGPGSQATPEAADASSPSVSIPNAWTHDVLLPREVFNFLMGTGSCEGVWFNDLHANLPGRFWWRAVLRTAERMSAPKADAAVAFTPETPDV